MLSYMLPVEEKPPLAPGGGGGGGKGRLQLELGACSPEGGGRRVLAASTAGRSLISKESSTSSFASSDLTTGSSMTPTGLSGHEKPKHKLLANGTKHTTLKRVSFGSSKGSMVETLIYESPLQEEPEASSPVPAPSARLHETAFPYTAAEQEESERSKVRVSFYQGVRPQCVSPPPAPPGPNEDALLAALLAAATDADMAAAAVVDHTLYNRQISTESGWDNPFRPDGDLSREADEIVSLIRGGKPITPTPGTAPPLPALDETDKEIRHTANNLSTKPAESPQTVRSNGTKNGSAVVERSPGTVEVQRSAPQEPQQAETVLLKRKPKCKCCVIQ